MMSGFKSQGARISVVPVLAALALAGCQTTGLSLATREPGPAMAPAPQPNFMVGDKFYYASGLRYAVTGGRGKQAEWQTSSNRRFTGSTNIFAPESYLETRTSTYNKSTPASADAIWPLSIGKQVTFTTHIRSVSKTTGKQSNYQQKWKCSVEGTEQVRVLAGTFDTYRVECGRYSATVGRNKWWQTYVYYYAPEIGHYVLREDRYRGKSTTTRQLMAVRPGMDFFSDTAARGIRSAFQDALENKNSGEISSYTDPKTGVSATVTPIQTFHASDGKFCRHYRQTLRQGSAAKTYAGVACREGKLKWLTPNNG